jgi:hypothetical protein
LNITYLQGKIQKKEAWGKAKKLLTWGKNGHIDISAKVKV